MNYKITFLIVLLDFAYFVNIQLYRWDTLLPIKYIIHEWVLWVLYSCGGAHGVMVIVVGNWHGDTSSYPGRDWLHFA